MKVEGRDPRFYKKVGGVLYWATAIRYDRDGTPRVEEWGPMPIPARDKPAIENRRLL